MISFAELHFRKTLGNSSILWLFGLTGSKFGSSIFGSLLLTRFENVLKLSFSCFVTFCSFSSSPFSSLLSSSPSSFSSFTSSPSYYASSSSSFVFFFFVFLFSSFLLVIFVFRLANSLVDFALNVKQSSLSFENMTAVLPRFVLLRLSCVVLVMVNLLASHRTALAPSPSAAASSTSTTLSNRQQLQHLHLSDRQQLQPADCFHNLLLGVQNDNFQVDFLPTSLNLLYFSDRLLMVSMNSKLNFHVNCVNRIFTECCLCSTHSLR